MPLREVNCDITIPPAYSGEPRIPLMLDPPDHAAYRRLILPLFAPKRADELEPVARQLAVRLLDSIKARAECEFLADFAVPYSFYFTVAWLGVPENEFEFLRQLGIGLETNDEGVDKFNAYFDALVEERMRTGGIGDDALSFLVDLQKDGRPLAKSEILRYLVLLFEAGLQTTSSSLGNMMLFLAEHPQHRGILVTDSQWIPSAVEELMRYESITSLTRTVVKKVVLGGQNLLPGDHVWLPTGSAGRDGLEFEHPDEVLFDRSPNRHLNFGAGPHRCIGSHMARMQLRVALEEIHRLIPDYQLMDGQEVRRHVMFERGVDELWLTCENVT